MTTDGYVLIHPPYDKKKSSERLDSLLLTLPAPKRCITSAEELAPLCNERILFAASIGGDGINQELLLMMKKIRSDPSFFSGCTGAIIIDGESELYTKSVGREIAFCVNQAGCSLIGRSLVEGTGSLYNFSTTAKLHDLSLIKAYQKSAQDLLSSLFSVRPAVSKDKKLLVLHSSNHNTSNTIGLWKLVKDHLQTVSVDEITLLNGDIQDCIGCPYSTCLHLGKQRSCFYGGAIVEEVFPALNTADALLLLCPNYNDTLGANLTAFTNRLTSLYRNQPFFDKQLFGIIVSGYSGGDLVAKQLISSLNMNKAFFLPEYFALFATANNPKSIFLIDDINERAIQFARHIESCLSQT